MSQLALRLKTAGTQAVSANHPEYAAKAAEAIELLARPLQGTRWSFTAEDVRRMIGDPPHPNVLGAALSAAARAGTIVAVGWTDSTRTAARGRPLRKWEGR